MLKEAHLAYAVAVGRAKDRCRWACDHAKIKRDAAFLRMLPIARATTLSHKDLPSAARARVGALDGAALRVSMKLEVD